MSAQLKQVPAYGAKLPDLTSDVKASVSDAEWQARVELAACYRLMPLFGMSDLVYNHITAKVPDDDQGKGGERFLINPYGYMYEEITASSLITIDVAGNVLFNPHRDLGINRAGYVIHSAVHAALPARTIQEFIDYAKANPGRLNYGSSGVGGIMHLQAERLRAQAGIDVVHVPYSGGAPAVAGVMANDVQFTVIDASVLRPGV